MDFTVLPPSLCPPRQAGGARTPPARALRASLNPACISRSAAAAAPSTSTSSLAAARTPPARALRVSLNPACVSRPSTAAAAAAAKKPRRPGLSSGEDPTNRPNGVGDGKENKNAPPPGTATASKVGTVLRPCSRVDEAPRLPLGNTTTRLRVTALADHAVGAPAAKRKATPADSKFDMLRPCSRGDEGSRSPLGNATTRLRFGAASDGRALGANAAKREATTPAESDVAVLRPCSRGEGASRLPLDNAARLRVCAAAEGHAAPASAAKRKAAPPESVPAKRRASPAAAASASPSPRSSDSGGTVRELLETARTATDAIRRREIERLRAASRRELDRVARTVEFNEPFITPQDVLR